MIIDKHKHLCTVCKQSLQLKKNYFICSFSNIMASNPRKILSRDLINKPTPMDVWLQGTIEQTVGSDILIISDSYGRVKVVKCESADGIIDKNSIRKGTYCCIIGVAIKTKGLPEVQATKFVDISSQPQMKLAWEHEVKEVELLLQGKISTQI